MYRITPSLLLFALFLPGILHAQQPSVVTLMSQYCEQFDLTRGSEYGSCTPAFIRKNADVVDERNGYLEIYTGAFMPADPMPTLKVAHYIHKGVHLLAVAEYENTSGDVIGQKLNIYQWSGTELSDVTRERFAQMLSPDERNKVCDDYGGQYNFETKTWEGCWWEYVLPRNGLTVQVKLHLMDGTEELKVLDYTKYDFDLNSGTFVRKYD